MLKVRGVKHNKLLPIRIITLCMLLNTACQNGVNKGSSKEAIKTITVPNGSSLEEINLFGMDLETNREVGYQMLTKKKECYSCLPAYLPKRVTGFRGDPYGL